MIDSGSLPDLAARTFGGTVMAASDEFFADKENLIKDSAPTFQPHTFTPKGQQYDGWETRRRFGRTDGHDWVILRLGVPGVARQLVVDTSFFVGNFPAHCSVEGTCAAGYPSASELSGWFPLLARSPLSGDKANVFDVDVPWRVTHVRLNIHPDGGVARFRVRGSVVLDPLDVADLPFDLVATANGAVVTESSDGFFSPPSNMLQPGESRFMADGWETARRRDDGHDWAVIRTACAGVPRVAEVATTHYRGNSPARVALLGFAGGSWFPLLPPTDVQPDTTHRFRISGHQPVEQVRLESFPDGGIARLRVYGQVPAESRAALADRWTATTPK
jgi:allantoicase